MIAELHKISKYYGQPGTAIRNLVLDDISLAISENASIAIVGPSGSGKTTLLNILGTLDHPSSGKVILDGNDITTIDENHLAGIRSHFIGFIFQVHYLVPQLTLLENVLLPTLPGSGSINKKETMEHAMQLIERVGLEHQIYQRPQELSVGESQRTAVVRALINRPKLLLADEPTGSLDTDNARELGRLLTELNHEQKIALVVVTHSMELAEKMNLIYRLDSGKLQQIR